MIANKGRRPIGGPSPFWTGSPPNLVTTNLVFHLSLLVVTSWSPSVLFTICIGRPKSLPHRNKGPKGAARQAEQQRKAAEK